MIRGRSIFCLLLLLFVLAVDSSAQDANAYYQIARELYVKKDFTGAAANLTKAITLDPTFVEAYILRAAAYEEQRSFDSALADYSKAIALEPGNDNLYFKRACFYDIKLRDPDMALVDYNEAIRLNPNNSSYYYNRSSVYSLKKQYQLAIADDDRVIKMDPLAGGAYYNRSLHFFALGELSKALNDIDKAIELRPKDGWSYGARAQISLRYADFFYAFDDVNKAIDLSPGGKSWFLRIRAKLEFIFGKNKDAFTDAQKSLDIHITPKFDDGLDTVVIGFLALKKDHQDTAAKIFLEDMIRKVADLKEIKGQADSLAYSKIVFGYLHGDLTADQLIARSDNNDKLTIAHTYIGQMLLAAGKKDDAISHFNWVCFSRGVKSDDAVIACTELTGGPWPLKP